MPRIKRGSRAGEVISWEEWFTLAKKGIANISPLEQAKSERIGSILTLVGTLAGIVVMAFQFKTFWWIEIILIGSLMLTVLQYLSIVKKIKVFTEMENLNSEVKNG